MKVTRRRASASFPSSGPGRLAPGPVVLVTSAHRGERNVMTLGWHMVMEAEPSLWDCYISTEDHTRSLALKSRERVVNVPTVEMIDTVVDIGNTSGEEIDKFATYGLTTRKAAKVAAPLVDDCYASFECRLYDSRLVKRVAAHVAPSPKNPRTIHYLGRGEFRVAGSQISRRRRFKPEML